MKPLLEIKNLSVTAGEKVLLHNVDLTIPEGEVHALLGPNGSGKTSLMMPASAKSRRSRWNICRPEV